MFLLFPGTYFYGFCNHLWWKCCVKSRLNLSHSQRLSLSIPIKIALIKKKTIIAWCTMGRLSSLSPSRHPLSFFSPLNNYYTSVLFKTPSHPIRNSDFFMFAFVHGWVKLSTGKIIIQWIFTDINVYFIRQCFLQATGSW